MGNYNSQLRAYYRRWRTWRSWRWRRWRYQRQERWRAAAARRAAARRAYLARRRAAAAAAARRRVAAAAPFIKKHKKVKGELDATWRKLWRDWPKVMGRDRKALARAGVDATRDYKLTYKGRQYWKNWRHQGWVASGLYHNKRLTPGPGRHHDWGNAGNFNKMIKGINDKFADKRKADAEAKKSNMRKANWSSIFNKARTKLGPFNEDRKGFPSAIMETKLIDTYGISKPLKSWKPEQINDAHKLIDDEYDRIQAAKQAQLKARSAFAYNQMNAAKEAAHANAAASAAMAAAEREAAKEAAEESRKQAAATANAVKNMTGTLNTTNQNVADSNKRLGGYVNATGPGGFNQINASVIKAGEGPKKAMSDLLTVQTAKLATFNTVPMDAIKALSLKAREKYNAGLASKTAK